MTAGYIDNPPNTEADPTALVPLENVFRLLEMFRYDAFVDERREGVLAMNSPDQVYRMRFETKPWYEQIVSALETALQQTYSSLKEKDAAIEELQEGIRELVKNHQLDAEVAERARTFLGIFQAQLS